MNKVVVTGLGVATPIGNDLETFWSSLMEGRSGIAPIESIDVSDMATTIGGEVKGVDLSTLEIEGRITPKKMDRAAWWAVYAARQALESAGLMSHDIGPQAGVVVGSGLSGLLTLHVQTERLLNKGPRGVSVFTIPMLMPNSGPANISLAFGITGPSFNVGSACASSGHALIDAYEMVRRGDVDFVVTGGTEASLTRLGVSAFINMKAMSKSWNDEPTRGMRPFDADRDGFIMSEGAGMVILESESHARARGAKIHAELCGYGSTSDAFHLVQPHADSEGASRAMEQAIDSAGWDAGGIANRCYVNAHGTSTPMNDRLETQAIRKLFESKADRLLVSSTKSMTGHMIGASAAVESIACVQALKNGRIPPTINYETADPDCDLNYVPNKAIDADVEFALCNTFGFGGHNVCLAFRKAE